MELEGDAQPEAERPRITEPICRRAGDLSETRACDAGGRVVEVRRIADVESLSAELRLEPLRHFEPAEQADVHVDRARPAHAVQADVAEPHFRDVRESGRIEEWKVPD